MRHLLAAAALISSLSSGCEEVPLEASDGGVEPTHVVIGSDRPRDLEPEVTDHDLDALVAGENQLAFEIYHRLRVRADGFTYSPLSISAVMARVYAGARRQTETELAETLHITLPPTTFHAASNALDLALTGQRVGFEWRSAQALWSQIGLPYLVDLLDLLAENYGADMHLVDFEHQGEWARDAINDWVAEKTEGRVDELVEVGVIAPMPHILVSNAVTFSAAWKHRFPKDRTQEGPFRLLDGTTVSVPTMLSPPELSHRYASGETYEAVELAYVGDEVSMVLIVPHAGSFDAVEEIFDAQFFDEVFDALAPTSLPVALPRWSVRSRFRLGEALAAMGSPDAFSPQADFSGLTGNLDLQIGAFAHQASISVDEDGTNAEAGSLDIGDWGFERIDVNRPFLFLVRDSETGAILFAGRVLNPTEE